MKNFSEMHVRDSEQAKGLLIDHNNLNEAEKDLQERLNACARKIYNLSQWLWTFEEEVEKDKRPGSIEIL